MKATATEVYERTREEALAHMARCFQCRERLCSGGQVLRNRVLGALNRLADIAGLTAPVDEAGE